MAVLNGRDYWKCEHRHLWHIHLIFVLNMENVETMTGVLIFDGFLVPSFLKKHK